MKRSRLGRTAEVSLVSRNIPEKGKSRKPDLRERLQGGDYDANQVREGSMNDRLTARKQALAVRGQTRQTVSTIQSSQNLASFRDFIE